MTIDDEQNQSSVATLPEPQRQRSLDDACRIAKLAEEFRGTDIIVLDLTAVTPVFDCFVIASASNPRQMFALAEEVRVTMKAQGNQCLGTEGEANSNWLVQDYGNIVLHVFHPETRKLYDLERLWADAQRVDWRAQLGLPPAPVREAL